MYTNAFTHMKILVIHQYSFTIPNQPISFGV